MTVGVSAFSDGEELPFTAGLIKELAEALAAVGYECTSHAAQRLASAELGAFVARELESVEPELVQVVHVLTHGERGDSGTTFALGSDGTRHPSAEIARWVNTVQGAGNKVTLFLLDLCHAGRLARLEWQRELADSRLRAWVIAATEGGQSANGGRFTQAVINVLRAAANGELDIDPTREHIPLQVVAPAIRREVNRLAREADANQQDVTASVVDISAEVDLPFFPNPRYAPGDRHLALRASLDPGLVPFLDDLDEGLDARHFVERGAGISQVAGFDGLIGCFAGREAQLKQLSPWLNRKDSGNLGVVTGSPGVGKSALLGVMVCAAHPMLRARTKAVWDRAAQPPYLIDDGFAAIHARQRSLAAIIASLAAQLSLGSPATVDELIEAIRALPVQPVIVVDALDEADNGIAVMTELLVPLATVARVLVGTRRYDQFAPLVRGADFVIDLDDVEPHVLQEDLYRYVSDLLGATHYRDYGAVRGAFATEVAKTLANLSDARWGEFLVAGLYTRYLITAHPGPITDPAEAERLGKAVPRTLPEVLDLDLAAHPDQPWLRPVLTALAHAHGQGMPASVLTRATTAFAATAPTHADLRAALDAGRFYLRQATDTDHTTLYRLFHQGLADHLREPGAALLGPLLDSLGPPTARDWNAAEPYLLRHAVQHAHDENRIRDLFYDPGFLLTLDPATIEDTEEPWLRRVAAALRLTHDTVEQPEDRRAALALNAKRVGLAELAHDASSSVWQPLWFGGRPLLAVDSTARLGESGRFRKIACDTIDGVPILAAAFDNQLIFVDLRTMQPITSPRLGTTIIDLSFVSVDGRAAVVAVERGIVDRRTMLWDVHHVTQSKPVALGGPWTRAIACGVLDGRPIAIGAAGTVLRIYDLALGTQLGEPLRGHWWPIRAVAYTTLNGRPVVVSSAALENSVRLWDLVTREQIGKPLKGHAATVTAITCTTLNGRAMAITLSGDHTVRMWDLEERRQVGNPFPRPRILRLPHWLCVRTLADGANVLVLPGEHVGENGRVHGVEVWDIREGRQIRSFGYDHLVTTAACVEIDGSQMLVVPHGLGRLDIRNLETVGVRVPLTQLMKRHISKRGVAISRCALDPEGSHVLLARSDGSIVVADLATGERRRQVAATGTPIVEVQHVTLAGRPLTVLAGADGTCRVWDPASRTVFDGGPELLPSRSTTRSIAFVSGGRLIALDGSQDGSTALAAMELGDKMYVFKGGADGRVRVWDHASDRQVAVIGPMLGAVTQIEVSQDGYLLIVAAGEVVCGKLRL